MRLKLLSLMIWACLVLLLFSCSEEKQPSTLNESEFFFSETLASISKDDSVYYIGTEDGDIIRFNLSDNQVEKFQTPFERIYKVLRDTTSGTPIYWVGTRDMGLSRCKMEGTKIEPFQVHGTYQIPFKGADYSVYDIFLHGQGVFVATSQGLFKVRGYSEDNDTLNPLFPADASENPLQVCSFQSIDNDMNSLFCASDSGVLKINLQEDKVDILGPKVGAKNLVTRKDKDFIYAFTGDTVFVIDKGKLVESIALPSPAQLYYHEDSLGINYFFSDDYVQLVKDDDLHNPECFQTMDFRYPTRTKCNNIIVNDKNHSLLVCDHALTLVGHHQDVFSQEGDVKLVCADKDKIYYLIGNSLFCQSWKGEEKNTPKAYQIKDLTGGTQNILLFEVLNDTLYYVDSDNHIFKTCLYDNYFKNSFFSLFSSDRDITPDSDNLKVLSIGKDYNNVYLGVRDGLRNINNLKKNTSIVTLNNEPIQPYITNFRFNPDNEKLYFSTLNDGVFCGSGDNFIAFPGTDSCKFIRDIEFINDTLLLLTNQKLYELKNSALEEKPFDLKGFSRLFALNGHVYGVRNYGIQDLETGVMFLSDIRFNPNACLAVGDTIIACSTNGAWLFNGTNNPETVKFEKSKLFSRTNLLIFLISVFALIIGAWIYDRYRIVEKRKARLITQIDELPKEIPDVFKDRINKLRANVLNVSFMGRKKNVKGEKEESSKEQTDSNHRKGILNTSESLKMYESDYHNLKRDISDYLQKSEKAESQKGELLKRIKELKELGPDILEDLRDKLENLFKNVDSLEPKGEDAVLIQLTRLSSEIENIQNQLLLRLPIKINTQMKEMKSLDSYDCDEYVKNSKDVVKKHNLQNMSSQFNKNNEWINKKRKQTCKLRQYLSFFDDLLNIENEQNKTIEKDIQKIKGKGSLDTKLSSFENLPNEKKMENVKLNGLINDYIEKKKKEISMIKNRYIEDEHLLHGKTVKSMLDKIETEFTVIETDINKDSFDFSKKLPTLSLLGQRLKMLGLLIDLSIPKNRKNIEDIIEKFYNVIKDSTDQQLLEDIKLKQHKQTGKDTKNKNNAQETMLALMMILDTKEELYDKWQPRTNPDRERNNARDIILRHKKPIEDYKKNNVASIAVLLYDIILEEQNDNPPFGKSEEKET